MHSPECPCGQGTTKSRADKLKFHGKFFPKSCIFHPPSARKLSEKVFITENRHRMSVTDTDCPWQTQTVYYGHRLPITDTDCSWQTQKPLIYGVLSQKNCKKSTHFHGQFFSKNWCSRTENILWKPGSEHHTVRGKSFKH